MAKADWPSANRRALIGERISRLDGPVKATGRARYASDINRPGLLYGKMIHATVASGKILRIDTSAAEQLPGVKAVIITDGEGTAVDTTGRPIGALAAVTEEIAAEALRKIVIEYELSEHVIDDSNPDLRTGDPDEKQSGDVDGAMQECAAVSEDTYGCAPITHCCHESHGQATAPVENGLHVWPSTQNVSGYAGQLAGTAGMAETDIHVDCQYMGGGFGSKFGCDIWGLMCVQLAQKTGKPVKLMLDRDQELMIAGARPSVYAKVKVGTKSDGAVAAWDSECWGSGGPGNFGAPTLPYVFNFPNSRARGWGISTNRNPRRAWRAPNHPQLCLITMSAMEDAAAALGMDALEFFKKNLQFTERPDVYLEELDIAADMIGYKEKAHLRGDSGSKAVKRGLGISIHTWGGKGHKSAALVTLNSDGSVAVNCGTQDLGTGTRTIVGIVVAETLGLPLDAVQVNIGRNAYPASGASGGSTTVGGVSSSSRDAATQALNKLLEKVAPRLGTSVDNIEAWAGQIRQKDKPENAASWKDACRLIGKTAITAQGSNPLESGLELTTGGVGGVQIADVSVDTETGVVTINEMVAVQDCGLVLDLKTAESQVYGGLIMGVTYALYEEAVYDPVTGIMLNPNMEFYRLAGLPDIGKLRVHMMQGGKYDEQGVIGLGEPPVISPGAAISNAVANACGVRVGTIPLTPDRVLAALEQKGASA